MKNPQKLYKLTKGVGGGCNENAIGIEHNQSEKSAVFVGKVMSKAQQLFGRGASLNAIATVSYGVYFKFPDEKKNRKMAKMLIKIVELEQELLSLKNELA